MKRCLLFSTLLVCLLVLCPAGINAQDVPEGFKSIFNGKDLTGWYAIETYNPRQFAKLSVDDQAAKIEAAKKTTGKHWKVEAGELVNDGHGGFLTTETDYRDFEFLIEYKTVPKTDSGIYLKATPQVQIWDSTNEKQFAHGSDKGSGGLWNNSAGSAGKDPLELADRPAGEWNQFRVRQLGSRTDVWLNGKHVVKHAVMENYWDRKLPLIANGPIQLQTHGGEIRWRNIFVREIDGAEANKILASQNAAGFEPVFNGNDFTGWKGPIDNYFVKNGEICCKPKSGGTIFTQEKYTDFVARLEFSLPPGGNNGLAIRYPGSGNAAYGGMCELQVLDNTAKKYNKLDDRQYHGSAYGMVASHRGYQRPVGEWNFQEVTVKGSTLKVELNGTIILDCDLSDVKDFMDEASHPGKNRKSGFFGLCGHNDPVKFRNLKIKKLGDQ